MVIYITDKSGKQMWRTNVNELYSSGERANMDRRLSLIKSGNKAYSFVDKDTAAIVCEEEEPVYILNGI